MSPPRIRAYEGHRMCPHTQPRSRAPHLRIELKATDPPLATMARTTARDRLGPARLTEERSCSSHPRGPVKRLGLAAYGPIHFGHLVHATHSWLPPRGRRVARPLELGSIADPVARARRCADAGRRGGGVDRGRLARPRLISPWTSRQEAGRSSEGTMV